MEAEEGSGSEMWPVVCFHGLSPSLGDLWYIFDYEKLSLVAHLKSENLGGWTIMGDDIYWAGGSPEIGQSHVSRNLLKHNITYPRSSTWEIVSDGRKLDRMSPLVVHVDRKLYVLGGVDYGRKKDYDKESQYWGEVYDLDSKKWEKVLELDDPTIHNLLYARCVNVMKEKEGIPTTVISFNMDPMLFYNLNEGTLLRSEYRHPSLDIHSGDSQGLGVICAFGEISVLREVYNNSRPVVRDSTLYWFTKDLYLYGYDFIRGRWLRSPCLESEISIMSPKNHGLGFGLPVLVDLCNGKFLVIRKDARGVLAIASFTVVKAGENSLNVSVETRHILDDLPDDFMPQDGMAMTHRKVHIKATNSYTNGIHPIFKVVSDIVYMQQTHDMASYLRQIETLKEQYNSVFPITNNLSDQERQQRDMFFVALALNGLRPDLIEVRHQILSGPSLPTLEEVSARLLSMSSHETSEMAGRGRGRGQWRTQDFY